MNKKGILSIVSGFSGSGKGTIMKELLCRYDDYALSISATTRSPRVGEVDGREYFFVEKEKFISMIEQDLLIEYASYVGNYYGTPKEYVQSQLDAGRDVVLEIEMQGALKVKEKYPDTLLIFVIPPSIDILKKRLIGRGTETEEVIAKRLRRAVEESADMEQYDYLLVNDDLDCCVEQLHSIIRIQHQKMSHNREFVEQIKKEISQLS